MNDPTASRSRFLSISRLLLGANGVLWLLLGVISATRPRGGSATSPYLTPSLVALMCANAVVLMTLAFRLRTAGGRVLRGAVLWVGINLLLSFTDEVGLADVMVGALNAVTLLLLVVLWRAGGPTSR